MPALSRKAVLTQGALMSYLEPKLAADSKVNLIPILKGLNKSNFAEKKAKVAEDIKAAVTNKLAKDADVSDLVDLLDAIEHTDTDESVDKDPDDPSKMKELPGLKKKTDDDAPKLMDFLKGKLSPEDMEVCAKLMEAEGAMDEMDEYDDASDKAAKDKAAKDAEMKAEEERKKEEEKAKNMVTKEAMDAKLQETAIAAENRVMKRLNDIRIAERAVAPLTGEVKLSLDSAEEIYKHTLIAKGVKIDGVHPSAYPAMVEMLKTQQSAPVRQQQNLAKDSADELASFNKQYGIDRAPRSLAGR